MTRPSDISTAQAARLITFIWDGRMYEIALSWNEITNMRILLLDSLMSAPGRRIRRVGPYVVPNHAASHVTRGQPLDERRPSYYSEPVRTRIISDYKRGYSVAQIGFMYALRPEIVTAFLKSSKVEMRKLGPAGASQAAMIRRLLVEAAARKAAGLDPVTGEPLAGPPLDGDSATAPE